jgi:hypothetical protein
LVFVPAVFTVLDDIGRVSWWIAKRFVGATDEPEATERPEVSRPEPEASAGVPMPAE